MFYSNSRFVRISSIAILLISVFFSQSFICCKNKRVALGTKLPFCLDVSLATFENTQWRLNYAGAQKHMTALQVPPIHAVVCMKFLIVCCTG